MERRKRDSVARWDMTALRDDLESPRAKRGFGSGWISGVLALVLSLVGLGAVLCLRYPEVLTVPEARELYNVGLIRLALHLGLIAAFVLGILSIVLREQKTLGFASLAIVLIATVLGGSRAQDRIDVEADVYLGLDWFLLNLLFTGIIFIPVERLLGNREQRIFRHEWREDLLYFLISSLFVQGLTFMSLAPAMAILQNTDWIGVRRAVGSQPLVLQFLEIMFLTDLVQYWVHRVFHRVPWLWKFHAIHHSAEVMDWLASSRMHVVEIVFLRGLTVIPMYVLGFSPGALYAYLIFVYILSALVHANLRVNLAPIEKWIVTPRFHHWHHGIEREAIDVNFAVHFPLLDRAFGTHYLPSDGRWPSGYGVGSAPVDKGFLKQLVYPFRRRKVPPAASVGVSSSPNDVAHSTKAPIEA
jgi:sterol desaturase/sphingolipid hydroxylase (fatty acid hydroxylase superfamily)